MYSGTISDNRWLLTYLKQKKKRERRKEGRKLDAKMFLVIKRDRVKCRHKLGLMEMDSFMKIVKQK